MSRFLNQPSAKYRDFQVVYAILTLNFALPSIGYIFFPEATHEQFVALNAMLGGAPYTFAEAQSSFWRFLGAANVATLAFMCAMLQWNLRRNFVVLVPLTFMKTLAATLWLAGFIDAPHYPAFLAAAVLDYVTSAMFVFFAIRARRDIDDLPDDDLVPRPNPLRAANRVAMSVALNAVLPTTSSLEPLVRDDLRSPASRRLAVGFVIASWTLSLGSLLTLGRPLSRLTRVEADAYVARCASSNVWMLRQLVEVVKVVAGFAQARR